MVIASYLNETLPPWSTVLLGKPVVPEPVKKFPALCRTLRFITVLITALHLFLS
jgi:hypothetical protein